MTCRSFVILKDDIPDYKKIGVAIFSWYFSLYSQGTAVGNGPNNFLTKVLGLGEGCKEAVKGQTTASIPNFPTDWVNNVKFDKLSIETRNRLALGAAGHRYTQALNYP